MSKFLVVGCYSKIPYVQEPQENGVFIVKLNTITGKLSIVAKYKEIFSGSFFAKVDERLFVVSEGDRFSVLTQCKIRRFESRSVENGEIEQTPLLEIEQQLEFNDPGACFVSARKLDDETTQIFVVCYNAGVIRSFKSVQNVLSEGERIPLEYCVNENSDRQEMAHPHCIIDWKGENNALAVVDLGADRIYKLHCSENKFALLPDQHFIAPPTSGPRHLIFHPTLPLAFLITELSNELLVLSPSNGTFTVLQKLSTIDYPGVEEDDPTSEIQNAAHIAFSNDGKFLLCSNRGKINSVVVYKINEKEKKLEFFDAVHSNGTLPRYFQLIDDKFLIVANQKGFNLTVFKYADGKIDKKPLDKLDIVAPICMQLL